MALGEASVKIVPDTTGFQATLKKDIESALSGIDKAVDNTADNLEKEMKKAGDSAEKSVKGIGDEFKKLGNIIGGAALTKGVVSFAKSSIDAASDLGESINAVQVTFGDLSDEILKFSETSARSVGLASSDFNSFAVRFAGFTKQIASGTQTAADVTAELTTRIADFASVMNLDLNEAATVFASTLAGESEAIRRFGIDMSAASIETFALATGMIKSKDEMNATIKVQATYAKLMADTSQVQGDFANTSDSLANRQRILSAEFKNMQVAIGNALMPALEGVLSVISPLVSGFAKIPDELRNLIAVVGLASLATFGMTKSLVGMAESAGLSTKMITNLKVGMGVLNVAMIAFALYQQQQQQNAQTLNTVISKLTTSTYKYLDANTEAIQTFMAFQDLSPEEMFTKVAEANLGAAARLLETGKAQDVLGISTESASKIIQEQIRIAQQAAEDNETNGKAIEEAGAAAMSAADENKAYVESLGFIVSASGEVEMSQENLATAVGLAQERFDTAVQAIEDYESALNDAFSAARSSIDTGFALVESQQEATNALAEYTKATKNGGLSQAELDKLARETAQTMLTVADNTVANAEALAAMNGQALTTAQTQELMVTELQKFAQTLDPASPLYQYLNGFIQTLGTVPTEIPIEMQAEVDAAKTELDTFKEAAKEIGRQITIGILEALAPLSPGFKKILDKMRADAGEDIIVNVRVITTTQDGDIIAGRSSLPTNTTTTTTTKPKTLADISQFLSFAEGGIFDQPQIGLFAEAGAEAIIPLTRPARALELMRDSGLLGLAQSASPASGQNFDITVMSAEPMRTAKDVVREFQALEYRMSPI